MHTSPVLILFLAYQDHLGHLYDLTLRDVYSSDKMDAYQWCHISKFSKFYALLIPYSYINASCYRIIIIIIIWIGSSSMLQQLQDVFLAGTIDTSDQDNVPQHVASI